MRIESWPEALIDFIESRRNTPFEWGVQDCTLFAADAVLATTGIDLASEYRGAYSSQFGAARIVSDAGGFRTLVSNKLGSEINPKLAQRGDLVLIIQNGSEALAVCIGSEMIAAGYEGLVMKPMSEAVTAWRVE